MLDKDTAMANKLFGYDKWRDLTVIDEEGIRHRTLYIYFTCSDGNNYLTGEITESVKPDSEFYVTVKYYEELLELNKTRPNFTWIGSCPYWVKSEFVFENKYPTFVDVRIPPSNREELPTLMAKVNMIVYDKFEYLRRTTGASMVDRYWVSDSPTDQDNRSLWWFDPEIFKSIYGTTLTYTNQT